jgi:serine/threonine-protein kinase
MSPEQARGQPTDKRCDIWSFGCVLYEMLAGKVPFAGETVSDTLANILQTEPDWQALPQAVPVNIRVLLRRCLEKDTHRRLRDIGDASLEINETLCPPSNAPPVTISSAATSWPLRLQRMMAWAAACLLFIVVVTSWVTWSLMRPDLPPRQPTRQFVIHPETRLARHALYHHALAISPDGKRLAYVEEGSDKRRRICLRELDEIRARPLSGTEGAITPFFSPDGQWLGYVDHHQRKLKKVSVEGGEPIILADSLWFHGGSWGEDDTIVFAPSSAGLWCISASGEGPQILPGGEAVLFTNRRKGGLEESQVEIYLLDGGQHYSLFKGGTYARYVPTGHIVYARKETLYAIRFDVEQLTVASSAIPVVSDVMTSHLWMSLSAQFAVSQDGTLAYVPVQARSAELRPVWVDRNGQVEPLPAALPRHYDNVTISPDGLRAAFDILDGEDWDIWIYDLRRDTLNPLTSDGHSFAPIWTPDGKRIVFVSDRIGKHQLFAQNADGSGKPELLVTFEAFGYPTSCSADGKEILVGTSDPNYLRLDQDISVVMLEREKGPYLRPLIRRDLNQRGAVWSPDGRWVAYSADESRRWEVYVEPYPGSGQKIQMSTGGGYQPAWSRDGKELFYRSDNKMIAATFETEPDVNITQREKLFEGWYRTSIYHNYDVAPDGRFLIVQEPPESTPLGINVVLNWFEELRRLVPVRQD